MYIYKIQNTNPMHRRVNKIDSTGPQPKIQALGTSIAPCIGRDLTCHFLISIRRSSKCDDLDLRGPLYSVQCTVTSGCYSGASVDFGLSCGFPVSSFER